MKYLTSTWLLAKSFVCLTLPLHKYRCNHKKCSVELTILLPISAELRKPFHTMCHFLHMPSGSDEKMMFLIDSKLTAPKRGFWPSVPVSLYNYQTMWGCIVQKAKSVTTSSGIWNPEAFIILLSYFWKTDSIFLHGPIFVIYSLFTKLHTLHNLPILSPLLSSTSHLIL